MRGSLTTARVATAILAALALAGSARAEVGVWGLSHGPEGGYVGAIAIDPSNPATIYVGGQGVFKSTNGGNNWQSVSVGLTGASGDVPNIWTIDVDPTNPRILYATGFPGGVFKSIDGGDTWSDPTHPSLVVALDLAIDPANPATLYVGTPQGLIKSIDAGVTWIETGLSSAIRVIAIDPGNSSTLYAGTSFAGIFKSIDGGEHWQLIAPKLADTDVQSVVVDPSDPATLYAGASSAYARRGRAALRGVFKSTDAGTSWKRASGGLGNADVQALVIDPSAPSTLYVGTARDGVFLSTSGGESWKVGNGGLTEQDVRALAITSLDPSTIYAGTLGGGIFRSTNGAGAWEATSTGLRYPRVNAFAVDQNGTTLFAGTANGTFRSTNGGGSWVARGADIDANALVVNAIRPQTLYAATANGVFESNDAGSRWHRRSAGLRYRARDGFMHGDAQALVIHPTRPQVLYAGSGGGVFKTTDGGGRWERTFRDWVNALAIDPRNPVLLFAGGGSSVGVVKSIDEGETWIAANQGLPRSANGQLPEVWALAFDGTSRGTVYAATSRGLFKRTSGATRWTLVDARRDIVALVISPASPSTVYAGTREEGVFVSPNRGSTWAALSDGLVNPRITALHLDRAGSLLYAGTDGSGVVSLDLSESPKLSLAR